jgi:hypothetical protein
MSATTAVSGATDLSEKQAEILEYLRANEEQMYFKSRLIGEDLGMSAKEVGANIRAVDGVSNLEIEQWGYSSATTWKVTGRS